MCSRIGAWVSTSGQMCRCFHSGPSLLARGRTPNFNIHKVVTEPNRQDPLYFEKEAEKLPLDNRYLDNLKILWTEKVGIKRELGFKADDNLVKHDNKAWMPDVDQTKPRVEYRKIDALATAPDAVKKVFSVEYGARKDLTNAWKHALVEQVKAHPLDEGTLEIKIARATGIIRNWTLMWESIAKKTTRVQLFQRPTWLTNPLMMLIQHRRKLLRLLRKEDEVAFERVLKNLKIAYHTTTLPEDMKETTTRKFWSEAQVKRRVEAEKERRLEEFRLKLENRREDFEVKMEESLTRLDEEEKRLRKKLNQLVTSDNEPLEVKGVYRGSTVANVSEDVMHKMFSYDSPKKRVTH